MTPIKTNLSMSISFFHVHVLIDVQVAQTFDLTSNILKTIVVSEIAFRDLLLKRYCFSP